MTEGLLHRGHEAGVLRKDFNASDLYYTDVAGNGSAPR